MFKRLVAALPVLVGISVAVFLMMHLVPGDPAKMMLGELAVDEEVVANFRHQLGLDDPIPVQYWRFLRNALRGDLGRSILENQPVARMIWQVLPSTVELTLAGMGVAVLLGGALGITAAVRHHTWVDNGSMLLALWGVSMPSFWMGLLLIFLFSLKLGWLPATGQGGWVRLVMPAFTLGYVAAAVIARLVRSSMLEVLRQDYVRTARAKGLAERLVVYRHALRNALIPVVTVMGLQFGALLGGTVVIETVFSRPGIGRLAVTSILSKDFQVTQGTVLMSAVFYTLVNIIVDASYAALDPRIRYD
ncbi:MAG: ABC transporter permease [Armatimonadota bacterium]|nr:ABC transporter permease [Armatimonadota bacterium]MDR7533990.1 ABC transporter permease [Armatimonadota bacterium]MDR7536521.1 ABC transporter permease [Armatimonadota bacterium]